jgi:hypothetical protein
LTLNCSPLFSVDQLFHEKEKLLQKLYEKNGYVHKNFTIGGYLE